MHSLSQKIIKGITMDERSIKLLGEEGRKNIKKNLMLKKCVFLLIQSIKDY